MDIHWHLCSSTRVPAKRLLPLLWKCQLGAGKWNVNLSNMGRSTIKHHVGRGGRGGGGGGFLAEAPGGWADRIWRSALSALAFPAVPVLHCWGLLALDKLLSEGLAEIAVIGSFGSSKSDGKPKHGRMEATLISSARVSQSDLVKWRRGTAEAQLRHRFNPDFHHQAGDSSTCCF